MARTQDLKLALAGHMRHLIKWLGQACKENPFVDYLPRRVVLRRALQISVALVAAPQMVRIANAADSCVDAASESLRDSLHYASMAPDPKQACNACTFFTSSASKQSCGNCMIMSGPVDETGHCDSWSGRG